MCACRDVLVPLFHSNIGLYWRGTSLVVIILTGASKYLLGIVGEWRGAPASCSIHSTDEGLLAATTYFS